MGGNYASINDIIYSHETEDEPPPPGGSADLSGAEEVGVAGGEDGVEEDGCADADVAGRRKWAAGAAPAGGRLRFFFFS